MTFIVTLVALLIERFFDWSHLRYWQWYGLWQRQIFSRIPGLPPFLKLIASIVPLLLALLLIEYIISDGFYGLLGVVFQVIVLLYCLGEKNLWADAFGCITALSNGDLAIASEKLKSAFGLASPNSKENAHHQLFQDIFVQSNRRVFAVVFWFAALGPAGALLYRLLAISANDEASPDLIPPAQLSESVMDWLPVRIFTFLFALGGHFNQTIAFWTKNILLGLTQNDQLLVGSGLAALGLDANEALPENGSAERDALSLLDRVFIIVLVILLLLAFI